MLIDRRGKTTPSQPQIDAVAGIVFQIASCSEGGARRWALQIIKAYAAAGAPVAAPANGEHRINGQRASLTREQIKDMLREAALTLRRLRHSNRDRPMELRAAWPDVVRATWDAYERDGRETPDGPATPGQIAALDRVLPWLFLLGPKNRVLVWARAERVPWRKLERRFDRNERTLLLWYDAALEIIRTRAKI